MINKKDLKEAIHRFGPEQSVTSKKEHKTVYYDDKGVEYESLDEPRAYKFFNRGAYECYVKTNTFGNLWSNDKDFIDQARRQASMLGVGVFKLVRVPREAFDHYIAYLKTGQNHYLTLAEREIC